MKLILTLYSQNFPEKMKKRSEDLYIYLGKKSVILCRGFISDYDEKRNIFRKALFFRDGKWVWLNDVRPNLIYDRSLMQILKKWQLQRKKIAKDFPFFNDLAMNELVTNKWETYQAFKEFSPKTVLIRNRKELSMIKKLNTDSTILKPLFGSRGVGIKIISKKSADSIPFPFIAQDLVETRKGIPGLVRGTHDLRVILADEKIIHSFLRMPPKGKLIANQAQGGALKLVATNQIPQPVKKIVKAVSEKLSKYPKKLFSIDFIIDDNQRPWIIELNSRPSIILDKEELGNKENYYKSLANFFKN